MSDNHNFVSSLPAESIHDLLKQTEVLLTETRLGQIAKDNKSISALLDHRTLYPIEDVYVRTKKAIQQEIDARLHSRRGGRGEREIKPQAALVLEAFREKGVHVDLLSGSYELEQQMWRTNCRSKNAKAEQRKMKFPELFAFRKQLDIRQKNIYRERVGSHLIQLAEELREECRAMKQEMDLNGIFHPEANAHRVHCAYIMKLHKKITPENVDDYILRKMYEEHIQKQKSEEELNMKKEEMLQNLTKEEIANTKRRREKEKLAALASHTGAKGDKDGGAKGGNNGSPARRSSSRSPSRGKSPQGSPKRPNTRGGEKKTDRKDGGGSKNAPQSPTSKGGLVKSKSEKDVADKDKVGSMRKSVLMSSKSRESMISTALKGSGDSKGGGVAGGESIDTHTNSHTLSNNSSHHNAATSPERRVAHQQKIFHKAYRVDKMGFADSSSILKEEAAKFHAADSMFIRKPRDKNQILEEKISTWMLQGIQQQQVEKAATRSVTIIPNDKKVWGTDGAEKILVGNYSPSKVMPFEDYYKVLRDLHQDEDRDKVNADPSSPTHSSPMQAQLDPNHAFVDDHSHSSHTNDNHTARTHSTHAPSQSSNSLQPINLIKHLHEHDPHFDAYLKVKELEQPSAKLFAKFGTGGNKVIKPKKIRRVAPLGRDAVHLVDSRGKESRLANKGFPNVFAVSVRKSRGAGKSPGKGDAEGEDNQNSDSDTSSSSDAAEGSAMERLEELELEDNEEASVNSAGTGQFNLARSPLAGKSSPVNRRTLLQKHRSSRRTLIKQDSHSSTSPKKGSIMKQGLLALDDHLDSLLHPPPAELGDVDMQAKLNVCWDVLQVPAMDRLAFMTKYSTQVYASEMPRAIDHWAEIAVIFVLFKQILLLRKRTIANALVLSHGDPKEIIMDIFRQVPPILASKSGHLVPLSIYFEKQTESLSAQVVAEWRIKLKDFLLSVTVSSAQGNSSDSVGSTSTPSSPLPASSGDYLQAEATRLNKLMNSISKEMCDVLLGKLEVMEANLSDVVLYSGKPLRDWVTGQDVMKLTEADLI